MPVRPMGTLAHRIRRVVLACLLSIAIPSVFLFAEGNDSDETETKVVVTIEQAEKTEYRKDADTGQDVIVFSGNVVLGVLNGDSNTRIQAERVVFNRERATVYATGDVTFNQSGTERKTETLTAGSLLFNTKTLEGVFDDGRVVQENAGSINVPTGSVLVVYADLFGRNNSGTITFRDGSLTFCDDGDPHWKINASRIWLLPGNEFGIFSGLLYVGNIPVLYLPFFYYPKDEMLINPSFGYDVRKGYFTQTTTYLIGRKPLSSDSSDDSQDEAAAELFNFMKSNSLKEQVREGLFLHNLDADAEMPSNSLKLMADVYSNLGVFVGVDGTFKPKKFFSELSFGLYTGFSKTLFPLADATGSYSVYSPSGERYPDTGFFMGSELPFRYAGNLKAVFSYSPFSFTLSLPFYSDPYFTGDFIANRSESMDWISFLLNSTLSSGLSSESSTSVSSYNWSFSGSIATPSFIAPLKPWLDAASLSSLSSQVNFSSKTNTLSGETAFYSPNRTFFYPSSIYPIRASARFSGKITSLGGNATGSIKSGVPALDVPPFLQDPADLADPAEAEADGGSGEPGSAGALAETEKTAEDAKPGIPELAHPTEVSASAPPLVQLAGPTLDVSYVITPQITTEVNYDSDQFITPKDIDWSKTKSSYLQLKSPTSLTSSATWRKDFLTETTTIAFTPVYQSHPSYSKDLYPDDSVALQQLLNTDYAARILDVTNTNTLSFKPFLFVDWLRGSSVSLNSSVKFLRTEYTGTYDNPSWKYHFLEWDKNSFTAHNVTAVLSMTQLSETLSESLSLKVNLPPLDQSYGGTLSLKFPFCTAFSVGTTIKQVSSKLADGSEDVSWKWEPFAQSSSWSFFDKKLSLSQSYRYNLEDKHNESLSFSASGVGASLSFSMLYTTIYDLVPNAGWKAQPEKAFVPYSARLSYSMPATTWRAWKNRISVGPTLSTSLTADLVRPTLSTFTFTPGIVFNLTDFLKITFSSESQNKVLFRYVQGWFDYGVTIPGERNILVDLFNSFAFWSTPTRQASGFKLKSFNITVEHNLHDWTLSSVFKVEPRLIKDKMPYYYDFKPYFKLSVKWNPMGSLKATIQDYYGEFYLNPDEEL